MTARIHRPACGPVLRRPNHAEHNGAIRLLQAAIDGRRTCDAMIVRVKRDLPDVDVYGRGVDRASQFLQAGGGIDDLIIAHVPYPNR